MADGNRGLAFARTFALVAALAAAMTGCGSRCAIRAARAPLRADANDLDGDGRAQHVRLDANGLRYGASSTVPSDDGVLLQLEVADASGGAWRLLAWDERTKGPVRPGSEDQYAFNCADAPEGTRFRVTARYFSGESLTDVESRVFVLPGE